MRQFYAKSRSSDKAARYAQDSMRSEFRELRPILAYKGSKAKRFGSAAHREWRLVTGLTLPGEDSRHLTRARLWREYEQLPIWKRLSGATSAWKKCRIPSANTKRSRRCSAAGATGGRYRQKQRIEELISKDGSQGAQPEFAEAKRGCRSFGRHRPK